jgi:hypothetical protein
MTILSVLGILLSLAAFPMARAGQSRGRLALMCVLLLVHVAATIAYYNYVQTNDADTRLYYFDPFGFYYHPMRPGTSFVVYMVQFLKETIGGSYLDYFLLFQATGFWGIAILVRTFDEIAVELNITHPWLIYLVLFLPGLHFWTSMIGKDAPLFMATSLAVWASMRLQSRFVAFGIALIMMVAFRPYIALVACAAMAIAAGLGRNTRLHVRAFLLLLAAGGAVMVAGSVQSSFGVDVTNAESVGDFFASTSTLGERVGGATAVVGASYPVRVLSLMFRPLFFDASGMLALIASFENLFILISVLFLIRHFGLCRRITREVFFLRFTAFFGILLTLLLGYVYYNVGLGLRQKIMIMPSFLTFLVAVVSIRMSQTRQVTPVPPAEAGGLRKRVAGI